MAVSKITKSPTPIELVYKVNELVEGINRSVLNSIMRDTPYIVGEIADASNLPNWVRLECVQQGITANLEPDWSTIHVGDVIADGSVYWIIDDIRDGGMCGDFELQLKLKPGRLKANGALVKREEYRRLFKYVQESPALLTSEAEWPNVPYLYTLGDGSTTFRIPFLMQRWFQGADDIGLLAAGLPNVLGHYSGNIGEGGGTSGALYIQNQRGHSAWSGSYVVNRLNDIVIDASRCSSVYKNGFTTVQPPSVQLIAQIKY